MFLTRRFYIVLAAIAAILASGVLFSPLFLLGKGLLVLLAVVLAADVVVLWSLPKVEVDRICSERFSLGDDNEVTLRLTNRSTLPLRLTLIDELPTQLQERHFSLSAKVGAGSAADVTYHVRPTMRGVYAFGHVLAYAATPIGLAERRHRCGEPCDVKVYPSYLMLRRLELMAATDNLMEMGVKKVRQIGNNTEFEQIRDYVQGDDYRTINWKASARRTHLMVNVYQDERAQQVFSVIDKGRLMQQSHEGMTLLDHAINASLVLSYVVVNRQDKAGIITFADHFGSFVPAERHSSQMQRILECLYGQQTTFGESDYSILTPNVNRLVGKRSFMMLYTNFTDFGSLTRQLPYLRLLNQRHRLLVVFFEDDELSSYVAADAHGGEEYYQHVIAEKLIYERRLIVSTLRQNGIFSLLTSPKRLSVDVINKYLEMKSRHLLV